VGTTNGQWSAFIAAVWTDMTTSQASRIDEEGMNITVGKPGSFTQHYSYLVSGHFEVEADLT